MQTVSTHLHSWWIYISVAMSRTWISGTNPWGMWPYRPLPNSCHWRIQFQTSCCRLSDVIALACACCRATTWSYGSGFIWVGGCGCYVFPVFGNDALVEVDVYIHTELFIIFRAMVSTPQKNTPNSHWDFTLDVKHQRVKQIGNTTSFSRWSVVEW